VHTVNFAVRREDFARVNGFDERFVGWGFEDSDLVLRLAHAGVRVRGLPAAGSVLHLHHEPCDRDRAEEHRRRIDALLGAPTVRCELGWERVDPEASIRRFGGDASVPDQPVLAAGR